MKTDIKKYVQLAWPEHIIPFDRVEKALAPHLYRFDGNKSLEWQAVAHGFPPVTVKKFNLKIDTPSVELNEEINDDIKEKLLEINPWRKGPFKIGPHIIDSEWQCQIKWKRLAPHLPTLSNKHVLDIGCNNGYFSFRMAGLNAKWVLGIDPSVKYISQFMALQHFFQIPSINILPIGFEDINALEHNFDVILCLGILYHHPNPLQLLENLKKITRRRGEIFLETLVLDTKEDICLCPTGKYAEMKKVYNIPSLSVLKHWIKTSGFKHQEIIDVSNTTTTEQRPSPWSAPVSLEHFLDPKDPNKTIEGYPAPKRALLKIKLK